MSKTWKGFTLFLFKTNTLVRIPSKFYINTIAGKDTLKGDFKTHLPQFDLPASQITVAVWLWTQKLKNIFWKFMSYWVSGKVFLPKYLFHERSSASVASQEIGYIMWNKLSATAKKVWNFAKTTGQKLGLFRNWSS